jgi:hypothetical protein
MLMFMGLEVFQEAMPDEGERPGAICEGGWCIITGDEYMEGGRDEVYEMEVVRGGAGGGAMWYCEPERGAGATP